MESRIRIDADELLEKQKLTFEFDEFGGIDDIVAGIIAPSATQPIMAAPQPKKDRIDEIVDKYNLNKSFGENLKLIRERLKIANSSADRACVADYIIENAPKGLGKTRIINDIFGAIEPNSIRADFHKMIYMTQLNPLAIFKENSLFGICCIIQNKIKALEAKFNCSIYDESKAQELKFLSKGYKYLHCRVDETDALASPNDRVLDDEIRTLCHQDILQRRRLHMIKSAVSLEKPSVI